MIFYITRNAIKTISVHFVSNTIRAIVKYLNYAISILGATSFFVVSCGI